MNIESLAEWSAANLENGVYVRRPLGRCPMFWAEWRANKEALKAEGIRVRPGSNGAWEIIWSSASAPVFSSAAPALPSFIPAPLPEGVVLSDEQQAIVEWFINGKGNLVVRARAGTGKTFTIVFAVSRAPERRKLYAVFGKDNQLEAEQKIADPNVDVLTLHALGLRFINAVWPGSKPCIKAADGDVEMDRIIAAAPRNTPADVLAAVNKLVAFAKNCFANVPSVSAMMDLADARNIQVESEDFSARMISEIAIQAMENAMVRDAQRRVSGNDMVWLPVAMGWVFPCYDLVVVDEAQDMNLPQLLMAIAACTKDGRVAVVGDDRQAIFAFRGAVQDGLNMMKDRLQAAELSLTITRRCPQVVVEHVQQWVPDYKAAPDAPRGELLDIGEGLLGECLQIGDAVLSRKNAPLMPICLSLLRKGMPAKIRGRDVGAQLAGIARKLKAKSVPHLIERVEGWSKKQIARCGDGPHAEAKMEVIQDQAACIIALAQDCVNVSEVFDRIEKIFVDKEGFQKPCVTLSSVHKAKGLEWNNVYLLAETFRPERGGEEENITYVAETRAKKKLTYVHGSNAENPGNN